MTRIEEFGKIIVHLRYHKEFISFIYGSNYCRNSLTRGNYFITNTGANVLCTAKYSRLKTNSAKVCYNFMAEHTELKNPSLLLRPSVQGVVRISPPNLEHNGVTVGVGSIPEKTKSVKWYLVVQRRLSVRRSWVRRHQVAYQKKKI